MSAYLHLHVSLHQTVHAVYRPAKAAEQDHDQHDDDQRGKSPTKQEVEQVAALCVLVVHHQHLPEVHGLRTQTDRQTDRHELQREEREQRKLCRCAQILLKVRVNKNNFDPGTVGFNVSEALKHTWHTHTNAHSRTFIAAMIALFAFSCDGALMASSL